MGSAQLESAETLVEAMARLEDFPEKGVTVLDRRGKNGVQHTYPEVGARARAWAAWFRAQGVAPGEVTFLCLPSSHHLVEAFLGLVLLRALPCVLALPRAIGGLDTFRHRIGLLRERFPGGHLLTTPEVGAEADVPFLTPPEDLEFEAGFDPEPVDPDDLAYIQLTSGSTTAPRAVAISHRNVAANTQAIVRAARAHRDMDFVSWLPLYHDMGLSGMVLTSLNHGIGLALMPPDGFVASPLRWLEQIAGRDCDVVTAAPNFGYQWCVDRIPAGKEDGLDLSNWRLAFCGAEMVRPATLTAFAERFAPRGFRADALLPCYGMAEATLAVTFSVAYRGLVVHEGRASCGPPLEHMEVEIRRPGGGELLPDGEEGEVVVRGPSIFPGYYEDPEATAAVLDEAGGFYTGDLGYLREGELYVTGRLKDLLILDGVNVAPYEIEWLAEEDLAVAGGRAAAFSVEVEERERPVLVVEVKDVPEPERIDAVRRRVGGEFAPLQDLVLVRRGTLPKTSSGKVQRGRVQQLHAEGALEGVLWRLGGTENEA